MRNERWCCFLHNDALLLLAALLAATSGNNTLHTSNPPPVATAHLLFISAPCSSHFFQTCRIPPRKIHSYSSQNERRDAADVADDTKQSSRYVLLQADGSQHTHTHHIQPARVLRTYSVAAAQVCTTLSLFFFLLFFSFSFFRKTQ